MELGGRLSLVKEQDLDEGERVYTTAALCYHMTYGERKIKSNGIQNKILHMLLLKKMTKFIVRCSSAPLR